MNQALKYEHAVQKIRNKNCSENDVSFSNATISGYAHTPIVADKCKIFHKEGGGLNYAEPIFDWLDTSQSTQTLYGDWFFTGTAGVMDVGPSGFDLLLILPYLRKDVCLKLNEKLNIPDFNASPPQDLSVAYIATKFTGSFPGPYEIRDTAGNTDLDGKQAGCFEGGGTPATGTYHFYYALIER